MEPDIVTDGAQALHDVTEAHLERLLPVLVRNLGNGIDGLVIDFLPDILYYIPVQAFLVPLFAPAAKHVMQDTPI